MIAMQGMLRAKPFALASSALIRPAAFCMQNETPPIDCDKKY